MADTNFVVQYVPPFDFSVLKTNQTAVWNSQTEQWEIVDGLPHVVPPVLDTSVLPELEYSTFMQENPEWGQNEVSFPANK